MMEVSILLAAFFILDKAKDYMKTSYLTMKQGGRMIRENVTVLD